MKLQEAYGDKVRIFVSHIPKSVRIEECTVEGKSVFLHDPKGKAAQAYD